MSHIEAHDAVRCRGERCDLQKRLCHPASCRSTCQQISYVQRNRRGMRLFRITVSCYLLSIHVAVTPRPRFLLFVKSTNCSPLLRSFLPSFLGLVTINAERWQKPSESFQHPHLPSRLEDEGAEERRNAGIRRARKQDVFARRKTTER